MRYITLLITLLVISISLSANAQYYRLKKLHIHEYYDDTFFVMRDSSFYYYSNGRGGIFTDKELATYLHQSRDNYRYFQEYYNFMKYDNSQSYNWSNEPKPAYTTLQEFDVNNNIKTRRKKIILSNGTTSDFDSSFYVYNGKMLIQSTDKYSNTNKYTYNFFKQPDTVFFPNGNPQTVYLYNSKQLLAEVLKFTTSNTLISKKTYYYSIRNEPDSVVEQYYPPAPFYDDKTTTYTYNVGGMPVTETVYRYQATSGGTVRHHSEEFTTFYGKLGRIDSIYYKMPDWSGIGWRNVLRHRFYYNGLKYIDSLITDKWDGTKWSFFSDTITRGSHKYHFSYEPYFPTSIATKSKLSIQTTMYPNPAADFLYIRAQLKQSEPYTIQVTDMNGRVLKTWNEQATQTIQKQIPVSELPPGAYLLKLHIHDAEATERFIISK